MSSCLDGVRAVRDRERSRLSRLISTSPALEEAANAANNDEEESAEDSFETIQKVIPVIENLLTISSRASEADRRLCDHNTRLGNERRIARKESKFLEVIQEIRMLDAELKNVRATEVFVKRSLEFESQLSRMEELPVPDRTSLVSSMLQLANKFKPYPQMYKAVCSAIRQRFVALRTTLASEIGLALKGVQWSKSEGATFNTDEHHVQRLRHLMASLQALQQMLSVKHSIDLIGTLPVMDVGLPPVHLEDVDEGSPPPSSLAASASSISNNWMVQQLVRPLARRMYFHFDDNGPMARNDRPHFLHSFAANAALECVAFLQKHIGRAEGSIYGNLLRSCFGKFNDERIQPPDETENKSLISRICIDFVDETIAVVNDIMEGRIEDEGLAGQYSNWMASIQSAIDFDSKLDNISGRRLKMTDIFFENASNMNVVTQLDLRSCKLLLHQCLNQGDRVCWSSSLATASEVLSSCGTILGMPQHWKDDPDLESIGNFLRGVGYGNEIMPQYLSSGHISPRLCATSMLERFLAVMHELRSRLANIKSYEQQWHYVKTTMIEFVRAFGESCGDTWEDMGNRYPDPLWPGEACPSSEDVLQNRFAGVHTSSRCQDLAAYPMSLFWVVRVGVLNTMKLGAEILRTWSEHDSDDIRLASLLKWKRDKDFAENLSKVIQRRRAERERRERLWSRRDSNDSMGIVGNMSDLIAFSPLSKYARSSGLSEKSIALAEDTLDLASQIQSDIRAEIQNNEDAINMIGPMRAIGALSKTSTVTSLAKAGRNMLGNVMSLARTVRTTAAHHAAPEVQPDGTVLAQGKRDVEGIFHSETMDDDYHGPEESLQLRRGRERLSGLSEASEESDSLEESTMHAYNDRVEEINQKDDSKKLQQRKEAERTQMLQEHLREEARISAVEEKEDADAKLEEERKFSDALMNGGLFQRQVVEMNRLCSEYVSEIVDTLSQNFFTKLSQYASVDSHYNIEKNTTVSLDMHSWWTKSSASHAFPNAISPPLVVPLKAAWLCRVSLGSMLHPDLFSLVWSAVAAKVDAYLYKRVVLDQTFTAYGVQQLSIDVGQLEAVFCLPGKDYENTGTESTTFQSLPVMDDTVSILSWSPAERGAIVEALGQLSIVDDGDISTWPCRWSESMGSDTNGSDSNELMQMHDMLCTRGVRTIHPEHALIVSTQRI